MPTTNQRTGAAAPGTPGSRLDRTRRRSAALQKRAARLSERAAVERSRHASLDAAYDMVDRDGEVGGGIIAGALAYRLFIWLLPLALVLVAGLGIAADAASSSPEGAGRTLGLAGLVSGSVAAAASDSARWYALLVGVPALLFATRSVLRVLIGAHRLVWTDVRDAAPRPTPAATLRLLALLLALFAVSVIASAARAWAGGPGIGVSLALVAPYAAVWLLVSVRLPHRRAPWRALVPGAAVFGLGVELLQLAIAYVIAPMALDKQGTYGALGLAASVLLGLFLFSRLVVAGAVVNATLWERRLRAAAAGR